VCAHLVMEQSQGLFSGAIGESGGCETVTILTEALSVSQNYSASLGCSGPGLLECLRALPVGQVMGTLDETYASNGLGAPVSPVIDGSVAGLKGRPLDLIQQGQWAKVPVIEGTNRDEYGLFLFEIPIQNSNTLLPLTPESLNRTFATYYGPELLDTIYSVYPPSQFNSSDALYVAAATDRSFTCPARRAVRAMAASAPSNPVWNYYWTFTPAHWIDAQTLGAYHTIELDFVWGNEWPPVLHTFGDAENRMVNATQSYWGNFATTGNPNNGNFPTELRWPTYNDSNRTALVFDFPFATESNIKDTECNYWDQFV